MLLHEQICVSSSWIDEKLRKSKSCKKLTLHINLEVISSYHTNLFVKQKTYTWKDAIISIRIYFAYFCSSQQQLSRHQSVREKKNLFPFCIRSIHFSKLWLPLRDYTYQAANRAMNLLSVVHSLPRREIHIVLIATKLRRRIDSLQKLLVALPTQQRTFSHTFFI